MIRFFHWGIESWGYGISIFSINNNTGSDLLITGVVGTVSAAALPEASTMQEYVRQSLTALTFSGASTNVPFTVGTPPSNSNQGVDGNLASWNIKQTMRNVIHLPFDVKFPTPVRIPVGSPLQLYVINATYGPNGQSITILAECIDLEVQMTILM